MAPMNHLRQLTWRDWMAIALGLVVAVAVALAIGALVGWPMPIAIGLVIVMCGTLTGILVRAKRG
jgi:hypothetical protein